MHARPSAPGRPPVPPAVHAPGAAETGPRPPQPESSPGPEPAVDDPILVPDGQPVPAEEPAADDPVETPSGKHSGSENFPVGLLVPRRLRPHVRAFYAFARAIDDIADNGEATAEEKLQRLQRMEDALTGRNEDDPGCAKAYALRTSLQEIGVTAQHGIDLIEAFKQDAVKLRYHSWEELMAYCRLSASPVGRYLLDLHGEDHADWVASDALCDALQVINHLQDCKDDYLDMNRVYLAEEWMAAEGCDVGHLDRPAASPALRRVIDRNLDGVEHLLETARTLPQRLRSRHLAMESAAIVVIAETLTDKLRREDPVAGRVKLSKPQYALCIARGVWRVLIGKRYPQRD